MKPNLWNVKELLHIPSGSGRGKVSGKGVGTSDYSSPDSLLGSQHWPENSQVLSQEMPFSSWNSKRNSQEGNEWSVSAKYQSKPLLFGGETKTHSAICSKPAIGVLHRFEEDKKRVKEKLESEMIHDRLLRLNDSLDKAKLVLEHINDSGETTHKTLEEGINVLTRTIKESIASVWDGFTPKIEAVITTLNSHSQTLKEMEDREAKLATATKDLSSMLQDLQRNMDSLKVDQGKGQSVLSEMQSLLTAIIEAQPQRSALRPVQMVNSEVQTSPGLVNRFCVVGEEKRVFQKSVRLCGPGATCLLDEPSEHTAGQSSSAQQTNTTYDQTVPSRAALCPLPTNQEEQAMHTEANEVNDSLWQQSFCTEAFEPAADGDTVSGSTLKQQVSHSPCILGSLQEESQIMAITNRPQDRLMPARQKVTLSNSVIHRGLQKTRSKKRPRGKRRALIPPKVLTVYRGVEQGNVFCSVRAGHEEGEKGDEELSPHYQVKNKAQCENVKLPRQLNENKHSGMHNDERQQMWNMRSHSTNSRQCLPAYNGADMKKKGKAKANAEVPQRNQKGYWNLFSFDDSD